ncbi:MAG: DEAD/DEAH box helicase [Deltaproteobacteria bacterium]|nr:MAG: DEAD/DEAH box helicase [Deltaproteobacteria bacterium]
MTFASLDLIEPLQRAVEAQQYENPTPIQEKAIPPLLEGRDVLGCAQTGTGKTAAFALPILQHIAENPTPRGRRKIRALVLSPTRELAAQIGEAFEVYAQFLQIKHYVIFGAVSEKNQIAALRRGFEVLVATPGRLLDLHGQGHVDLSHIEFFVLDEADKMLDMGFLHDIRRILALLPEERQNLLFSATMPDRIAKFANSFLRNVVRVEVTPQATTVEQIEQQVMFLERNNKRRLLVQFLRSGEVEQAIVFTRTKHGANRLVRQLERANIQASAIHGNKSQNARRRALDQFRDGSLPVLVATDVASRGIDVDGVSHVFNFDLPNDPETYVHRIGRTGRAGRTGTAIAFCDPSERAYLRDIEKLIGQEIPVVKEHEWHAEDAIPTKTPPPPPKRSQRRGRHSSKDRSKSKSKSKSSNTSPGPVRESGSPPTEGETKKPRWHRRRRKKRPSTSSE